MFKNLIYFTGLLLISIRQKILAFQPVTENDYVLVGHVLQHLHARDWFDCIQACQDEPRCISYNYERSAGVNGLCELNDCAVEDLCDRNKSLFYSLGFVFQQIRKSRNERICCLDKSVPSVAPENVTALNTTPTSIFLTWHAVPSNQRSGNLLGYKVNFTLQSKLDDRRHTEEVSVAVAYVNLTGLRKGRKFSITVSAFNECGDGPRSVNLFVRTDEDRPDAAPQNITAVNKTLTSILIKWGEVPKSKRQGRIQRYKVEYTSTTSNETKSKEVQAPTQYLEIVRLEHSTTYTITVMASTSKGYGPASEPILVTTDKDQTVS